MTDTTERPKRSPYNVNPAPATPAQRRLREALQQLGDRDEYTPCAGDDTFTDDDPDVRAWAAIQCTGCPVRDLCAEAGVGEVGIYGGVDQDPSVGWRENQRREVRARVKAQRERSVAAQQRREERAAHPKAKPGPKPKPPEERRQRKTEYQRRARATRREQQKPRNTITIAARGILTMPDHTFNGVTFRARPVDDERAARMLLAWETGDSLALSELLKETSADPYGTVGLLYAMTAACLSVMGQLTDDTPEQLQAFLLQRAARQES